MIKNSFLLLFSIFFVPLFAMDLKKSCIQVQNNSDRFTLFVKEILNDRTDETTNINPQETRKIYDSYQRSSVNHEMKVYNNVEGKIFNYLFKQEIIEKLRDEKNNDLNLTIRFPQDFVEEKNIITIKNNTATKIAFSFVKKGALGLIKKFGNLGGLISPYKQRTINSTQGLLGNREDIEELRINGVIGTTLWENGIYNLKEDVKTKLTQRTDDHFEITINFPEDFINDSDVLKFRSQLGYNFYPDKN